MKKLKFLSICVVLLLVFESCESFIPDPVDPRLSKYTEEGLNVSSALINDAVWIAEPAFYFKYGTDRKHYMIYQPVNDTLNIEMRGNTGTVKFIFIGYGTDELQKLNTLREKKIPVDNQKLYATLNDVNAQSGQVYFKYATATDSTAVLSGTFGFNITAPPTKVTHGRFDMFFSKNNNYIIK